MPSPIFEIADAHVWRGETLVLSDFSLRLNAGESVAILGPNGAGKSTLLKLLTGELRPAARLGSTCRLFGEEQWSLEEIRHRIGVIMPDEVTRFDFLEPTRSAVLSSLRGAYGVTRHMHFTKAEKIRAKQALELMGVGNLADLHFGALSSGQQRRILIARALVHHPEVLLLDEPSTALDFAAASQLTRLIRDLMHRGQDIILVTHHPAEIPPEMNRVILLRDGKIFADGEKLEVISSGMLSELYQLPLRVSWIDGWCDVRAV